jgi:hypothetical protein
MQGSNAKAIVQSHTHHWVYFIFKQNQIAHHHRFLLHSLPEGGPGSQSHKGFHRPTVYRDGNVGSRKANLEDAFFGVDCTFDADDVFEDFGVETDGTGLGDCSSRETR